MEDTIEKSDLFRYTFYNDSGEYVAVLNADKIKELLGVDVLVFEENYGK